MLGQFLNAQPATVAAVWKRPGVITAKFVLVFTAFVSSVPATNAQGPTDVLAPPAQACRAHPEPPQGGRVCRSAAELIALLRSNYIGRVTIPKDADFDLTGARDIPLRSGIRLVGERGELGRRPVLRTKDKRDHTLFKIASPDVIVEGLHLQGPSALPDAGQPDVFAIEIYQIPELFAGRPQPVLIVDNELDAWPGGAVHVLGSVEKIEPDYDYTGPRMRQEDAGKTRIERNYIHHNARKGGGYGVVVGRASAYATVMGNVFEFNRHAVTSSGYAYSGYIARFNYVLEGSFRYGYLARPFDVHGVGIDQKDRDEKHWYGGFAGEYYLIAHNTIRGGNRPAFSLRGRPVRGVDFKANVLAHHSSSTAFQLEKGSGRDKTLDASRPATFNFRESENRYGTDYSAEIAAGDFDGDGRADVFLANGTAWFFSRAGIRPWEFLRDSDKRVGELGFADIDNDGATDVLYRQPDGLLVYFKSGKSIGPSPLTNLPVSIKDVRFGDFDGDGLTDMFYTLNRRWHLWYGAKRTWTPTERSDRPLALMRFGEFDDVAGTDILALGTWTYSSGATKKWDPLNASRPSTSYAVAGNFNGDGFGPSRKGVTDILFQTGSGGWAYSRSGRGPAVGVKIGFSAEELPQFSKQRAVGRFDGGMRDGIVGFRGNHLVIWWLNTGLVRRSGQNMR